MSARPKVLEVIGGEFAHVRYETEAGGGVTRAGSHGGGTTLAEASEFLAEFKSVFGKRLQALASYHFPWSPFH